MAHRIARTLALALPPKQSPSRSACSQSRHWSSSARRSIQSVKGRWPYNKKHVGLLSQLGFPSTIGPLSALQPSRSMFIQTQETPNPHSLKFLPGTKVPTTPCALFLFSRKRTVRSTFNLTVQCLKLCESMVTEILVVHEKSHSCVVGNPRVLC